MPRAKITPWNCLRGVQPNAPSTPLFTWDQHVNPSLSLLLLLLLPYPLLSRCSSVGHGSRAAHLAALWRFSGTAGPSAHPRAVMQQPTISFALTARLAVLYGGHKYLLAQHNSSVAAHSLVRSTRWRRWLSRSEHLSAQRSGGMEARTHAGLAWRRLCTQSTITIPSSDGPKPSVTMTAEGRKGPEKNLWFFLCI